MMKKKWDYTGKPMTEKDIDAFLNRIYLKPRNVYDYDESKGKFILVKRKKT